MDKTEAGLQSLCIQELEVAKMAMKPSPLQKYSPGGCTTNIPHQTAIGGAYRLAVQYQLGSEYRQTGCDAVQYQEELVYLGAMAGDLLVALLGPVVSVGEVQQRRLLGVLKALEQRCLAPHRHDLLYLLDVVLGTLQPTLKGVDHVACFLDVLPDACQSRTTQLL